MCIGVSEIKEFNWWFFHYFCNGKIHWICIMWSRSIRKTDQSGTFDQYSVADMGQNDTIGKIELNPSFILSSDNTNYKNDIQ